MAEPKHDVAISFLSQDEALAATLSARLSESLGVFFFPRSQEELAAKDGLEAMRTPFLSEGSRVALVLYRDRWGDTPWTGVEAAAIKDRCLADQFRSLVFVVLDKAARLPPWLPHTHIWLSFPDYGLEQTIGVIKRRVEEQGGVFVPPSASSRARALKLEKDFLKDKQDRFRDQRWIMDVAHPARGAIYAEIERLAQEISDATGIQIAAGSDTRICVLTNRRVSVVVRWRQQFTNVLEPKSLAAVGFDGPLALPGERVTYADQPVQIAEIAFDPELSQSRELCWVESEKPSALLTGAQVADKCVQLFIHLAGQATREDHERGGVRPYRPGGRR